MIKRRLGPPFHCAAHWFAGGVVVIREGVGGGADCPLFVVCRQSVVV